MDANPRVAVGDIVRRVCLTAHEDLETMSREVAALDDRERKVAILKYLKHVRHRFIKLLVLLKWACESGRLVDDILALQQDYGMNEVRVFESVAALRRSAIVLHTARAPVYDVVNAVDVLSSGTYLRLPRAIARLSGNPRLDDRLPEMDEAETLRKLEQYILERLLHQKAPEQFTTFRIDQGSLVCRVEHEFEVVLTLSGAAVDSPWVVLSVAIFVAGDSSTSHISAPRDDADAKSARPPNADDAEDEDKDAVVAMLDDDGSEDTAKAGEDGATNTKKRRRVDARDASAAFRPKKAAVLYLLRVLQQRLLTSKTPLHDVYEVVHMFCASVSIKMLEAQARELTEHHWKFGALLVQGSPQGTSLELRHWDKTCMLRICFDPEQREGQLFVELDPPIDTSVTRSSIAAALVADAHALRRRQLQLEGSGEAAAPDKSFETADAGEGTTGGLVDGLCPSALNVEKILLLGALAHAESRLNRIGLQVDELVFELETSASSARIERPAWALSQFRNTPSIVTQADDVALHISLPVERTLEVTVEMRSGDLMLSLLRKAKGPGGYRSARRWGASTDLLLLSAVERQVAKAKVAQAASGIVRALFLLSVHAILESVELGCEELQLPTSRSLPFILDYDPQAPGVLQQQRRQQQKQKQRQQKQEKREGGAVASLSSSASPPCIFIRLSAINDHEYYLCVGGRGVADALFGGIPTSGEAAAPSSGQPPKPRAGDESGATSTQLEWTVVGGPARKAGQSVCIKRAALLRAGPLPGVTENFSSDATVRATLEAARAQALEHLTTMQTTFLSRTLRCPTRRLAANTIAIPASRLLVAAFGESTKLCIQIEPGDVLHLDVRANPVEPALPFGKPPSLLTMAAAEREAQYASAQGRDPSVRVRLRYVRAAAVAAAMRAIGPAGSNVDTTVAAMHEILARAMLMLQGGHANGCVRFGQEPAAPAARVLYAGPDGVAVHASHEGLTVDALVTFADGAFSVTLLGGLSLPWVHEIVTLLNEHIRPDLHAVDWDAAQQVARQVLASLAFGLPTVTPIREALTSKPDKLLGSQPETPLPGSTPGGTPGPGGRAGGKFGLSMRIMSQKASANQGARIVTLLPLSHLRLRLFVGEIHRVDLLLTVDGVKFNSLYANNAIKEDTVVPYNQFSRKLKSCLSTVLGASS